MNETGYRRMIVSPHFSSGGPGHIHSHLWVATFVGGAIVAMPVTLRLLRSGEILTWHVIAVSQMLMSSLLIHVNGGRIETHFHIFGSLALLVLYRDWKVLISDSIVMAIQHAVFGLCMPGQIYGASAIQPWRRLEHRGWVARISSSYR